MENNSESQALVLVLIIVTIFASIVVTIAALTARELEMREVDEMALNTKYASDTAFERAKEVVSHGLALKFDGVDDYIDVGQEDDSLQDADINTWDQFTIEGSFKIEKRSDIPSNGFAVIIGRGNNTKLAAGSIGIAGPGIPNSECWPYDCCPYHLYVRGSVCGYKPWPTWVCQETWVQPSPGPGDCNSGWNFGLEDENKWHYFSTIFIAHGFPTWYSWIDGQPSDPQNNWSYMASNPEDSTKYNINIGKSPTTGIYFKNFKGMIDEIRIYKHPQICGNPPTFFNQTQTYGPPEDPKNHYLGIYDYQDNNPCEGPGVYLSHCTFDACKLLYPNGYDMENNLVLYYNFEDADNCDIYSPTGQCITDSSSDGNNNGTPVNFTDGDSNSGWTMPAPKNSKGPISLPLDYINENIYVDKNSIGSGPCGENPGDDCDPMDNEYSYSFYIIPHERNIINGTPCTCPGYNCCCDDYCISTAGQSP